MTVTTVGVICDVSMPDDSEFSASRLDFTLSGPDYDAASNDAIPAATVSLTLDGDGLGTVQLWPVDRGALNRHYNVAVIGTRTVNGQTKAVTYDLGKIRPPEDDAPHDLADLLTQGAGPVVVGSTVYASIVDAVLAAQNAADEAQSWTPAYAAALIAQLSAYTNFYTETDAEMASIAIDSAVTIVARICDTAGQVAPEGQLSWWVRNSTPGTDPYFTTSGGVTWTETGLRSQDVLAAINSAIAALGTEGQRIYATRAAAVAALTAGVPATVTRVGWYTDVIAAAAVETIFVTRVSGATEWTVAGWLPDGKVYPEHWGATNYGTLVDVAAGSDAYSAIAAAYAYVKTGKTSASNGERGKLNLRARYYRLSQTFVMDADRIDIECPKGAVFYIAHSSGAGVWLQGNGIDLGNLEVRGDTTRAGTMNAANMGVRIEPAVDDAANLITQFDLSRAKIRFHGGSGVVANNMSGLKLLGTEISNIKRHGVVVCNYAETGRTGSRSTGMVKIGNNTRINTCEGHRILIGAKTGSGAQSAYRINIIDIDGDGCGTNKAILEEDTTDFIRASAVNISGGAFPVEGMAAGVTLSGDGVVLSGDVRFTNGGVAPDNLIYLRKYSGSLETTGVHIGNFQSVGLAPAVAAVDIGADIDPAGVRIFNPSPLAQPLLADYSKAAQVVDSVSFVENGATPFDRFEISGLKPKFYPVTVQPTSTTGALVADRILLFPVKLPPGYPVDSVDVEVTTGAAGNMRIGLYDHDPTTGLPTDLIEQSADIDTSTTGVKTWALSTALTGHRLAWLAAIFSATPTMRIGAAGANGILGGSSLTAVATCLRATQSYGALPLDASALTLTFAESRLAALVYQA